MPIYDFKCPSCQRKLVDYPVQNRDEEVKCVQCHAIMKRLFPTSFKPMVLPRGGLYLEHVSPEGKTFYSYGEMRRYAKKHDLELGAL